MNNKDTDVARDLSDVLAENRTMISLNGIIFAFLLTASIIRQNISPMEEYLLSGAIITSVLSLGIFAMPVLYHHLQFPYQDRHKFILRSHRFITYGFIPFALTFILSTALALYTVFQEKAFVITIAILLILLVIYVGRKWHIVD